MDEPYGSDLIQNLEELHGLLLTEESLEGTLKRVAELARATIDGCDAGGVTLLQNSKVFTAAATDDFTRNIDDKQYETREGPCLQALNTQEVVWVDNVAEDTRWPHFSARAVRDGLGSVLSLPLSAREKGAGALNLYSRKVGTFREGSRHIATLFASQASVAISNAQVYSASLRLAEQLQEAIKSRELIGEAKGILMARERVSEDEAFEMLKKVSQSQNIKLRDIAQKIVDDAPNRS